MTIAAALAELERSPALHDHIDRLRQVAEDEQHRRERFYNDLDEDTKAEYINGQIVVHSPARFAHLQASQRISTLLHLFTVQKNLGEVFVEKCLIRCQRNDYEPDICFFTAAKVASFTGKQSVFPPPDLIVEVLSPSTENNDRQLKRQDYARHGVAEYWIVDADEQTVEQYILLPESESYELRAHLPVSARLESQVLAGFDVPVAAFFRPGEYRRAMRDMVNAA